MYPSHVEDVEVPTVKSTPWAAEAPANATNKPAHRRDMVLSCVTKTATVTERRDTIHPRGRAVETFFFIFAQNLVIFR
jgi:hypothetical protein